MNWKVKFCSLDGKLGSMVDQASQQIFCYIAGNAMAIDFLLTNMEKPYCNSWRSRINKHQIFHIVKWILIQKCTFVQLLALEQNVIPKRGSNQQLCSYLWIQDILFLLSICMSFFASRAIIDLAIPFSLFVSLSILFFRELISQYSWIQIAVGRSGPSLSGRSSSNFVQDGPGA